MSASASQQTSSHPRPHLTQGGCQWSLALGLIELPEGKGQALPERAECLCVCPSQALSALLAAAMELGGNLYWMWAGAGNPELSPASYLILVQVPLSGWTSPLRRDRNLKLREAKGAET